MHECVYTSVCVYKCECNETLTNNESHSDIFWLQSLQTGADKILTTSAWELIHLILQFNSTMLSYGQSVHNHLCKIGEWTKSETILELERLPLIVSE